MNPVTRNHRQLFSGWFSGRLNIEVLHTFEGRKIMSPFGFNIEQNPREAGKGEKNEDSYDKREQQ